MDKRNGWIAAALASCVGGTALAQQTYQGDPPPTQDRTGAQTGDTEMQGGGTQPSMQDQPDVDQQPTREQDMGATTKPPAGGSSAGSKPNQATKPQSSSRLSQIQSDGVPISELDPEQVKNLQLALQEDGYYAAEIDGIVGPKTKRALRQYYSDQAQLAAQGMILPQGAAAFGLDETEIERVRGEDQGQPPEPEPMPGGIEDEEEDMAPAPSGPTPSPGAPQINPHGTTGDGTGTGPGTGLDGSGTTR